jgi:hypothetical protein
MFLARIGLTKVLGLAALGTIGLFGASSAQAGGFRLSFGVAPVVYAQPAIVVQQPTCPTPVYAPTTYYAPASYPTYTPAYATPDYQPVYQPAPVYAPAYHYDRDDWRRNERHEFIEHHERFEHRDEHHDNGFRTGFRR